MCDLASLIPATRDDITAEWLDFVLRQRSKESTESADKLAEQKTALKFEVTLGAEPGTNYATTVYAVHVTHDRPTATTEQDENQSAATGEKDFPSEHQLIIKLPHDDPFGRFFCYATRCYEREILFYAELAPALEAALGEPIAIPRYYHGATDGQGGVVMVMEDLRAGGYRMPAATEMLGMPHIRLVVEALARVVGAGLALQHGDGGITSAPLLNIDTMWRGPRMDTDLIRCGLLGYIGFLSHYPGQEANISKLEALLDSARDIMVEGMHGTGGLRSVCHGDLWKLNMMFRCSAESDEPDAVMLLDWQHCHVGNFLVDLFSVLVNNTDREFRRQHTEDVLKHFHGQLVIALQLAGVQPEAIGLSFERLLSDYKATMKAALMRVIFDVVLPLADADATRGAPEGSTPQRLVDRLVTAMAVKTEDQRLERHLLQLMDEMNEAGVI